MPRKLAVVAVTIVAAACASAPSQERLDDLLQSTVSAAGAHYEAGQIPEAEIMLHAVSRIDPEFAGVAELQAKLAGKGRESLTDRGWLGINRRLRVRTDRRFLTRLFLYVPDRLLDALDLVTVDVHVAFGALADVHVTRAVQAVLGLRGMFGAGVHDQRSIGIATEAETGFAALAFGAQTVSGSTVGIPAGFISASSSSAGMQRPSDEIYQDYRDYWGIGASVTAGLAGASAEFHPIQIADLLGGFFLIDFARDDLATTRRLDFDSVDYALLKELSAAERAGVEPPGR